MNPPDGGGDDPAPPPPPPPAAGASPPRPAGPCPRRRRSIYRLAKTAPRKSNLSRDVATLEQRAEETQRRLSALQERNARLRRTVTELADEFMALELLVGIGATTPAPPAVEAGEEGSGGGGGGAAAATTAAAGGGGGGGGGGGSLGEGAGARGADRHHRCSRGLEQSSPPLQTGGQDQAPPPPPSTARSPAPTPAEQQAADTAGSMRQGRAAANGPSGGGGSGNSGAGHQFFGAVAFRNALVLAFERQQATLRQLRALGNADSSARAPASAAAATTPPPPSALPAPPLPRTGGRGRAAATAAAATAAAAAAAPADRSNAASAAAPTVSSAPGLPTAAFTVPVVPSEDSSSELFRASVLGLLAETPADASVVLGRLVSERAAERSLGPRPLEAAIALWRGFATRSALLLRRLDFIEREAAAGAAITDGAAVGAAPSFAPALAVPASAGAAAKVMEQINAITIDSVAWLTTLLKHYPSVLDEIVLHRLDDERSPPERHDEHALEAEQAIAAVRAARLSDEQNTALRSAFRAFRRNMAEPVRLWREAGVELMRGAASATAPPSMELMLVLERLERCVAVCSMHRTLLASRMYSVFTPRQFAGLLADVFPFFVRPAPMVAAFVDADDGDGGGGGGGGGGDGDGRGNSVSGGGNGGSA